MHSHLSWAELPATVRAAVTTRTGPITAARDVPNGFNCQHASILTASSGSVFVKAARADAATAMHHQEQAAAPHVAAAAPQLRWRIAVDGWDVLGFDAIPDARHAELGPGSADLDPLATLLQASTTVTAPANTPAYATQWSAHGTPDELAPLHGDTLVHGDINQHNILVSGGRAWLVDWATTTSGPAWADVAEAAIRLMEDGCTADEAHAWARQIPAWRDADPAAIEMWGRLRCRAWTARIGPKGAAPSNSRHESLARAVSLLRR